MRNQVKASQDKSDGSDVYFLFFPTEVKKREKGCVESKGVTIGWKRRYRRPRRLRHATCPTPRFRVLYGD